MNFLEALREFLSGKNPDRVLFEVVNQLLDEFISYKTLINKNISDIRFDELRNITYERLIKEGFKSVEKYAVDEENAKTSIRYLISQYFSSQYINANPKIEKLNDDVKYLLNQFSQLFPQVGSRKLTEHKFITISSDIKEIEILRDYDFAKNEPRKTRLKEIFFIMVEILNQKKSLSYSELINNLKVELNIDDLSWVEFKSETEFSADQESDNESNQELENYVVNVKFNDRVENPEIEDSNIICATDEIDWGIDLFLKLCTERQRIVFGVYILLKYDSDQEKKEFYYSNLTELSNVLNIKKQTLYNEKNKSIDNLAFVFKKLELNEKEKQLFMKKLISGFENYFKGSWKDVS